MSLDLHPVSKCSIMLLDNMILPPVAVNVSSRKGWPSHLTERECRSINPNEKFVCSTPDLVQSLICVLSVYSSIFQVVSMQCTNLPSLYHSARGRSLFRSGVINIEHFRVSVSPSVAKVTPNFSRNWTSIWVKQTSYDRGTIHEKMKTFFSISKLYSAQTD